MLNLRRAFSDICRGYTVQVWAGRTVYIKHLSHHDQTDVDDYQDKMLAHAKSRKIATEAERLKWLNDRGFWTAQDQNELDKHRVFTDNLAVTKTKMPVKAHRDAIGVQLDEAKVKLDAMITKRTTCVGLTAEASASAKVQYEYVRLSLFKDETMKKPLFQQDEMAEMSDEESYEVLLSHIDAMRPFSQDSIKRIALASFFTNYFYLCGEQYTTFFGRPVAELTFFQVNLLSYGIHYRNILANQNVPDHVKEDPDKLEEFVQRSQAVRAMGTNAPAVGGRVAYVGAQSEDFKDWGMEDGTKDMRDLAKGGGTRDSMEEARRRGLI